MNPTKQLILLICLAAFAFGCNVTGNSSKFAFADAYYRSKLNDNKKEKYYLTSSTDSIKVYPPQISREMADTVKSTLPC
jgi:hypothetical protein